MKVDLSRLRRAASDMEAVAASARRIDLEGPRGQAAAALLDSAVAVAIGDVVQRLEQDLRQLVDGWESWSHDATGSESQYAAQDAAQHRRFGQVPQ